MEEEEINNQAATPTPQEMIDIDIGDEGDIEEEEDGEVDSDSNFMLDQETTMHTLELVHTFWFFEFYTIICSHSYVSVVWGISESFVGIG